MALSDGWADLGMYLPDADDVSYIGQNINETKGALSYGLADKNTDIRRATAYVIEEIGPPAALLRSQVVAALRTESDPLVRIYLCNALRAIGDNHEEVLAALRAVYSTRGDDLNTVDQRIYSAAALSCLSDSVDEKIACTAYVLQWLDPESSEEHDRTGDPGPLWSAVNAVENMPHAQQAIPLLKRLLSNESRPSWVDLHVPRALVAIEGKPAP